MFCIDLAPLYHFTRANHQVFEVLKGGLHIIIPSLCIEVDRLEYTIYSSISALDQEVDLLHTYTSARSRDGGSVRSLSQAIGDAFCISSFVIPILLTAGLTINFPLQSLYMPVQFVPMLLNSINSSSSDNNLSHHLS